MGAHLYPAQQHHLFSRKLRGSSFRCLIALLKHSSKGKASQLHLGYSPKLGSLGHPFSFTPRGLVSMRKCLTSSLVMSPEKRDQMLSHQSCPHPSPPFTIPLQSHWLTHSHPPGTRSSAHPKLRCWWAVRISPCQSPGEDVPQPSMSGMSP